MRPRMYCLRVFTASIALSAVTGAAANSEDDSHIRGAVDGQLITARSAITPELAPRQGPVGANPFSTSATSTPTTSSTTASSSTTSTDSSTAESIPSAATIPTTTSSVSTSAAATSVASSSSSSTISTASATSTSKSSSESFHWSGEDVAVLVILLVALVSALSAIGFFKYRSVKRQRDEQVRQQTQRPLEVPRQWPDIEGVSMAQSNSIPPIRNMKLPSNLRSQSSLTLGDGRGILDVQSRTPADTVSPMEFSQATDIVCKQASLHQFDKLSSRSVSPPSIALPAGAVTTPTPKRMSSLDRSITPPTPSEPQSRISTNASLPNMRSTNTQPSDTTSPLTPLDRGFSFDWGQVSRCGPRLSTIATQIPSTGGAAVQSINGASNHAAVIVPIPSRVGSARSQAASFDDMWSPVSPMEDGDDMPGRAL